MQLTGNLFSADNSGNLIGVEILDNGSPAVFVGTEVVTGYAIRSDGATVTVTGSMSGTTNNKVSIILPASAYICPGEIRIIIKVDAVTVGACIGYVYRTTTDTLVDPGHVIPSIEELLEQIDDCEEATAAAMKVANVTVSAEAASGTTPDAILSEVGSGDSAHKHILFKLVRGEQGEQGIQGEQGVQGEQGDPPDIYMGTFTTLEPGTQGSATLTPHTGGGYDLNLSLPRGYDGAGTVSGVTMNGSPVAPDSNHIVNLGTVVTEIEDSLTSQSTTKALSAKQGNVLAGKIMSKAWTPESGDTLLSYIANNVNKGDLPFSGVKVGSVTVSDSPFTSAEFTILITGHTDRLDVYAREYGSNGGAEYYRAIWQGSWNGNWRRVDDLRADASSVAIMNGGDTAQSAISSGDFVYIREHSTLAEGLYRATDNIAVNGTISAQNVASVTKGLGGILSKAFILETYSYNYSSLAVDGYKAITASEFGITAKSGYTLAGIVGWKTGSYNVFVYGVAAVTDGSVLAMRNRGTAAVSSSVTASVTCLWVRNELI